VKVQTVIKNSLLAMQNSFLKKALGVGIVFIFLSIGLFIVNAQDEDSSSSLCRLYSTTVDNVVVRSCASESCTPLGNLNLGDSICVRNRDEDWYQVDLEPDNPESGEGYVLQSLLYPGLAEVNDAGDFEYCDANRIIPEEAIIRQCPSLECNILYTLIHDEVVCVATYGADYSNWIEVAGGVNGVSAWVNMADLGGVREERSCEAWRVTSPSTTVRSCPDFFCDSLSTLTEGSEICSAGESFDEQPWLGIYDDEGRFGWIYANLVEETTLASNELFSNNSVIRATVAAAQTLSTAVASSTSNSDIQLQATVSSTEVMAACTEYRVIENLAIVRERPSTDAPQATALNLGSIVCVTGVVPFLENEWFIVQLTGSNSQQTTGFMSQSLLTPVNAALPSPTPSPLPSGNDGLTLLETPSVCPTDVNNSEQCVPVVAASAGNQAINLPLTQFLSPQIELNSPQSTTSFRLELPQDWAIQGNNTLNLSFVYSEAGDDTGIDVKPVTRLDIRIDNELIESIALSNSDLGVQTLQVPLPSDLLADTTNRSHLLEIELTALDHCEDELVSRVLIDGDASVIHLEYQETAPIIDLAAYPRPFYEYHPNPEIVYVVLPNNPSAVALTSAARIVAGLGAVATGLNVETITISEMSDATYRANNLILVGQPSEHSLIADYYARALLPTSLGADNLISTTDGQAIATDDGILQIIPHPEDSRFAILIVTGQSDTALLKAGQALGGRPTVISLQNNLTIVSDAIPTVSSTANNRLGTGLRFDQLGYEEDIVLTGIGEQTIFIEFFVPFGVVTGDDAFVNLLYNSSSVLEQVGSTLTLSVNDVPIASTSLDYEADSSNPFFSSRSLQAKIPSSAVLPGRSNYISITLNTQELKDCQPYDDVATWLTIGSESEIFLPISLNEPEFSVVGFFPAPFNLAPALSEVMVVVPDDPKLNEINQAMDILFYLGANSPDASGINPQIVRGFSEDIAWQDYHLIVIGRPSTNSFFSELADDLPQPFVAGTDELEQIFNNVTYRLNDGYDVGLLESFASPFNPERTVLVITGTNDATQELAVSALATARFSFNELLGDVVFISEGASYPINSQTIAQAFEILQAVPLLATESALVLQSTNHPMTAIAETQGALVPTTTPFGTATVSNPANMTDPIQETAILVIESTEDTVAISTVVPLQTEDLMPTEAEQPVWVQYLIILTVGTSIAAILYLFVPMFLKRR
jgi:hypothetical protein